MLGNLVHPYEVWYDSLNVPRKVSGQGLLLTGRTNKVQFLASLHQVYLGSPACVSSKKARLLI